MLKSPVMLLTSLLHDAEDVFRIRLSKDSVELYRRFHNHGMWFLEVLLPTLDDALTSALSSGHLEPIKGFKCKPSKAYPEFLSPLWALVFGCDGKVLADPDTTAILFIRQISRAYKKVFEVCSDEHVEAALTSFLDDDRSLETVSFGGRGWWYRDLAQAIFGRHLSQIDYDSLEFKHGPGAVADRLDSVARWEFASLPKRLLDVVPFDAYHPLYSEGEEVVDSEIPARLVKVPKTATKPRLISIEPSYNQFAQQGLLTELRKMLSRFPQLSIESQDPNKLLAQRASIDGAFATLDLSSASDLVSWRLVREMFSFSPRFVEFLDATRSRRLQLPDGSELLLNKFASMGSALTFPVQMMYFTTLIVAGIMKSRSRYDVQACKRIMSDLEFRVYGDDIIVPTEYARSVAAELTSVGLKVNGSKSFFEGYFRESCGGDYYRGTDVTPTYVRRYIPANRYDTQSVVSWVAMCNQFDSKMIFPNAVRHIKGVIRNLGLEIPYGDPDASEDIVFRGVPTASRWNPHLQRAERRGLVMVQKRKATRASDQARLKFSLARVGKNPEVTSEDDLWYHRRPTAARLNSRWVPAI